MKFLHLTEAPEMDGHSVGKRNDKIQTSAHGFNIASI